jgi:hypothetical protein
VARKGDVAAGLLLDFSRELSPKRGHLDLTAAISGSAGTWMASFAARIPALQA